MEIKEKVQQVVEAVSSAVSPSADKAEGKLPFSVYARIRGIDSSLHKAMLRYPPAKGKEKASLTEWDELFKSF